MNVLRRPTLFALLTTTLLLSCVDGESVTESEFTGSAELSLVTRFVEPAGRVEAAGAVDQIRLTARHATSGEVLATSQQNVDATADSWQLDFNVPVPSDGGQVVIDVELISGGVVEWSGQQGPLTIIAGASATAQEVAVYRGPLDNLAVTGVTISGAPTSLAQGGTVQLTAAVQTSGSGQSPTVFWGTTDPAVATVAADGTVTGVAPGTARITASAGPASDEVTFPVRSAPGSIVVTPATVSEDALGRQLSFTAEVLDLTGTPIAGALVNWSSSDPTVLQSVTAADFLTTGNGQAQAVATSADDASVTGSATVTVRQDITTLLVDQPVVSLTALGQTVQIAATALDALGAAVLDAQFAWSAADPTVATVTPTGQIEATGPGTTTVSVTASEPSTVAGDDSGPARVPTTETVSVTVTAATATGLTVTPMTATMTEIGGTLQIAAAFIDATGTATPATTGLTWLSTQVAVASVDATGLVTALSTGSTVIRASGQGFTAEAIITVGGADMIVHTFMVTPDGQSTVIDVTQTGLDIYVDNVGTHDAPASDLAVRVLDPQAGTPIMADVLFPVPALAAGARHTIMTTLGGTPPGALPSTIEFKAIADVGGVVAEDDEANNDALSAQFPVQGGGGAPPGTTSEWTGAIDTDWFNPGNWTGNAVPNSGDNLWIPVGPSNQPAITTGPGTTGDLILEPGAQLFMSAQQLDVFGDLDAGTTITGGGLVRMFGAGTTVKGNLATIDLHIFDAVQVVGPLDVNNLVVDGASAEFDANGQQIVLQGNLDTSNGGKLRMDTPGAVLNVQGTAFLFGSGTSGALTQGTLYLGSGLDVGADPLAFSASASHLTSFGPSAQSVVFGNPGSSAQTFQNVLINSGASVSFDSDAHSTGDVILDGSANVTSGFTLDVGGNFTINGSGALNVDGTLNVLGTCSSTGVVTGPGSHPCPVPAFSKTWVGGDAGGATDWDNPNNWSPIGVPAISDDVQIPVTSNDPVTTTSVDVNDLQIGVGATLDVTGPTLLRVHGDLDAGATIIGSGPVRMLGTLKAVQGTINTLLRIHGGSSVQASGPLTVGNFSNFQVEGDFDVGGQAINVAGTMSVFGAGQFYQTSGGSIVIGGSADFNSSTGPGAVTNGALVVAGNFTTSGATTTQFTASPTHQVQLNGSAPQTIGFANPASDHFGTLRISNPTTVTFTNDTDITGDLDMIQGTAVIPSGRTVDVAGTTFVNAGTTLTVDGTLTGTCVIVGAGIVNGSGTHSCAAPLFTKTWVGGDSGGPTDWNNANNWSPVGVPGSTDDVLIPVTGNDPVSGFASIAGIRVDAGATLDLGGSFLGTTGDIEAFGAIVNGTVNPGTSTGTDNVEGTLPGLRINPNTQLTATGPLNISDDLILQGSITVTGQTVAIGGLLNTTAPGPGSIVMGADPNTSVLVGGNVAFSGGSENGLLTDGALVVLGDFNTSTANDPLSFRGTGNHRVVMAGTGAQTLNSANPVAQTFSFLDFQNSGPGITLNSDIYVTNDVGVGGTGTVDVGSTRTLDVTGDVTVQPGATLNVDGTLTVGGTCTIIAGGSVTGTGTHPCVASAFNKIWVGGDAGGAVDWFNNNNWNPTGAPTASDDVLIPATANDPQGFGATLFVNDIQVDPGATLDLQGGQLDALGNVDALGVLTSGILRMAGSGVKTLQGTVPILDVVSGLTATLVGATTADDVTTQGTVHIANTSMTVLTNFTTSGANGRVQFANPAALLDVMGDITFSGGTENGYLNQGIIQVAGDFTTSTGNNTQSFWSTGTKVIFTGSAAQTLTMGNVSQPFVDLENQNGGSGLMAATDFLVQGLLTNDLFGIFDASSVTVSTVGGIDDPNNGMSFNVVSVEGSPSVMPPTIGGDVQVITTAAWPNNTSISGSLDVTNGTLDVNGQTITVGNNLDVNGAASRLQMTNAASLVTVQGNAFFDGPGTNGYFTNGVLELQGDLNVGVTHSTGSFYATGQHETVFDGLATQNLLMGSASLAQNHFQDVTIRSTVPNVVMGGNDLPVQGTLDIESGAAVTMGGNDLVIAGAFNDPGLGFSGSAITVFGNLASFPTSVGADVTVLQSWNLPGSTTINGDLIVDNSALRFDANTVTVNGNVIVQNGAGRLHMNNAASVLDVNGSLSVDGGGTNGWMTSGTLQISGGFTQLGTNDASSFHPSGPHTTVFDGTGAQTISFASPGSSGALSLFANVTIANTAAAVTGTSALYADGTVAVNSTATLDLSAHELHVRGALLDPTAGLNTPSIYVYGNLSAFPATVTADVFVTAGWTLNGTSTINGNLTANNATLQFDANALTVNGNATAQGANGRFYMNNGASALDVNGDFTADGASTNGWLVNGVLSISGAFVQGFTHSGESFHPSGGHQTVFDGTGAQSIVFASPGNGGSQSLFQNVTIQNTAGAVTGTSNVFADGTVTVNSGASLDLSGLELRVGGGLQDPGGGLTVPDIYTYANLGSFPPTVNSNVTVTQGWTLNGSTTINGNLLADNATLQFDANTLTVNGNATAQNANGRFYMNNASSGLDVNGDFVAAGAGTNGWLVQGVLSISGNFTQANTQSGESFHASSAHTTVFDGTGAQSVSFASPGSAGGQSLFQNVTISNTSGAVTGTSAFWADGTVDIQSAASLDLTGQELRVAGALLDPSGGLTSPHVYVYGNLSANPFSLNTHLHVVAGWTLTSNISINGALSIDNATFQLDANTVFANADVFVTGANGRFYMNNGASVMDIAGNLSQDGGSTDGWLAAGTLKIGGDFTQGSTHSVSSFRPTGTHLTTFDGSGAQTISFASPGPAGGASQFRNMDILNGVGTVTGTSTVYGSGTIDVNSGATLDLSGQQLFVAGGLLDPAGGLTVPTVYVNGNASAFPANYTGNLIVTAAWNLPNDISVTGTTTVNNVTMQFDANTFTSGGNFIVTGANGRIYMNNAAGVLDANANFSTTGTSMDGYLTAGTLRVAGNFTIGGSNGSAYRATGVHNTVFDGTGAQVMQFAFPGPAGGSSQFRNLTISNPSGIVSAGSHIYASGTVDVQAGTASFDLTGQRLNVAGALIDPTNAMTTPWISTYGDLTAFPATVTTAQLSIEADWTLNGSYTLNGDAQVLTGNFRIGANTFTVNGNFITGGTGRLYMNNPAGVLDVSGFFTSGGVSTDGWLTAGTLFIGSSFLQAGSADAFRPTGTHTTIFDGTGPQNIQFTNPGTGAGASQFKHFGNQNTGGQITFDSDAFVLGQLTMGAGHTMGQSSGSTLQVGDGGATASMNVTGGTFNGLRLRLVSNAPFSAANTFNNATLSGYALTDTQIYIRAPGVDTETWTGLTFNTTPAVGAGGAYIDIDSSNGSPITLNVTGTTPGAPGGNGNAVGVNATLNWS